VYAPKYGEAIVVDSINLGQAIIKIDKTDMANVARDILSCSAKLVHSLNLSMRNLGY